MERLQTTTNPTERDQRERLEQVQMELRVARAKLATASEDASRAEQALRDAIDEATVRRDAARVLVASHEAEKRALQASIKALEPRLVEKRQEAAVLARGAVLRDHYVDWNPEDRANAVGDGLTGNQVLGIFLAVIAGLLALTAYFFATK